MGKLVINNITIDSDLDAILDKLVKSSIYPVFKKITKNGTSYQVTCPFHKNGQENKPSCGIVAVDDTKTQFGVYHCFTCGESGTLSKLVNKCLNTDGDKWLVDNFGIENGNKQPTINFPTFETDRVDYIDETEIDKYAYYHPYMWERKLSKDIIDKFEVGFDKATNSIVFPVRDEHGKLVMFTKRSVNTKNFYIDKNKDKPVYLMYDAIRSNYKSVIICESQINCLYCQSLGYPAIATFGCNITKKQFEILNKAGIRHYIVAFDGDDAGRHGLDLCKRFINKDIIVDFVELPEGKDVNDLSTIEIDNLFKKFNIKHLTI